MKIVKKPENDVIILNSTAWDRSNLTVSGQVHFTHEEASRLALQEGKRLPDRFDISQLQNLYRVEDKELHGMWFAEKKKLLKTDQSLFLPAMGSSSILAPNEGFDIGFKGRYWSASTNKGNTPYYLWFRDKNHDLEYGSFSQMLSIRLVQDV